MSNTDELRPLFLLSDEPLTGDEPDDLERDQDARLIAEVVLGNRGPFAVGVYGEWGSGKTTLLHRVRRLLSVRNPDTSDPLYPYIVPVHFNAWQHGRDKEPIAFLAAEIRDAIALHLRSLRTPTDEAGRLAMSWLRSAMDAARAGIAGVSGGFEIPGSGVSVSLNAKDMIDRYEALQKEREDPDSRAWKEHVGKSVVAASLRSMRADDQVLGELRPGEERRIPRVVVFIDDLDRCTAEEAVAVLRGIKLALAQPGFVFVMTLNPDALTPYVQALSVACGHAQARSAEASDGSGKIIYLDKLIQLPYSLRLRSDRFGAFCTATIEQRLKDHVPIAMHSTLCTLRPALRDSSLNNPRTFKRLVNAVLIAAQRAPSDLLSGLDTNVDKARALLAGLYLLQSVPERFNRPGVLRDLSAKKDLCSAIAAHTLEALACAARKSDDESLHETLRRPLGTGNPSAEFDQHRAATTHADLLAELYAVTPLNGLFKTDFGQRWLKEPHVRRLAEEEWSQTPPALDLEPEPATLPTTLPGKAPPAQEPLPAATQAPTPVPETPRAPERPDRALAAEIAIIERAARANLGIEESEDLTPEHWARVIELDLPESSITDRGVTWLAHPKSDLIALTSLTLRHTKVTDAGVKELARPDTGLKALTALDLRGTHVTDAGVKELARPDTGLKALTALDLRGTHVTDAGVKELARPDTGLRALTSLNLWHTKVTDAGVKELARPDTGLKALTSISLSGPQVTDAGVKELARPDTGLRALASLILWHTKVTDAGVKELARPDTGLKALASLHLWKANVTDAGVKELARPDTGLKALTSLDLSQTAVTSEGVRELARPDTGLKSLRTLQLSATALASQGMEALASTNTGLGSLTTLDLHGTNVTDTDVAILARPGSGLNKLTTLDLSYSVVTNASIKALAAPSTGLRHLSVLKLVGTNVTEDGLRALAESNTGLQSLQVLELSVSLATPAVIDFLRQRWPNLKVKIIVS